MKTKIIRILVCVLLMTTMSMSAIGEQNTKPINCTNKIVKEILYHEDHGSGIWRMKEDGTAKVEVLNHGWFATHYGLNSIIFGQYYNNGIRIINSGGVRERVLSTEGDSPHGSDAIHKIVYHVGGVDPSERRIWIMDMDGSNAQMITDTPGNFAEFSPDGTMIAFAGATDNDIYLIEPDGTNEMKLLEGGTTPTWDPSGNYIAYVNTNDGLIWKIRTDGTGAQQLSEFKGIHPDWDPDGEFIAYEYYESEPPIGIRAVKSDSTNDHEISSTGHAPRWYRRYNNPSTAPTITGQTSGKINTPYEYTFNSVDPDGDGIHYYVDWGDGTNSGWGGPYPSGQDVKIFHTYTAEDTYTIEAMTQDVHEYESDWSTLSVQMPRMKNIFENLFTQLFERFPNFFTALQQILKI